MSKLLTSTLGAMAVVGQVPDLREGDCVRALSEIDYENMPPVKKGFRGMVTGKGITWEGRDWLFAEADGEYLFKQRNAVIHRSMVQKMSETEGYGVVRQGDNCLTVFELEALNSKEQSPKLQWFPCEDGWVYQMFILPACGFGPGQLRWAKNPTQCAYRNITKEKLELSKCDWTQPFVFTISDETQAFELSTHSGQPLDGLQNSDDGVTQSPNRGCDPSKVTGNDVDGFLKVGVVGGVEASGNPQPECFGITQTTGNSITGDSKDAGSDKCAVISFAGLWNAELLDV